MKCMNVSKSERNISDFLLKIQSADRKSESEHEKNCKFIRRKVNKCVWNKRRQISILRCCHSNVAWLKLFCTFESARRGRISERDKRDGSRAATMRSVAAWTNYVGTYFPGIFRWNIPGPKPICRSKSNRLGSAFKHIRWRLYSREPLSGRSTTNNKHSPAVVLIQVSRLLNGTFALRQVNKLREIKMVLKSSFINGKRANHAGFMDFLFDFEV